MASTSRKLCIGLLIFTFLSNAFSADECLPAFEKFEKKCYGFSSRSVNSIQAAQLCRSVNATPATIESAEEQRFVSEYINTQEQQALIKIEYWLSSATTVATPTGKEFVWTSNWRSITYNEWCDKHVDIPNLEICISIKPVEKLNGCWDVKPCQVANTLDGTEIRFICQTALLDIQRPCLECLCPVE